MPGRWRLPAQRGYYKRPPHTDFTPAWHDRSFSPRMRRLRSARTPRRCARATRSISPDRSAWTRKPGSLSTESGARSIASFEISRRSPRRRADRSPFARVNEIMARYFDKPYPARAAVGVAALPRGALVEADAILVLGS